MFEVLLIILLIPSVVVNFVFAKRLVQFDNLFTLVNEDLEKNIEYLGDMFKRHITTNAPEIITLDENLKLMKKRFETIASVINEKEKDKA